MGNKKVLNEKELEAVNGGEDWKTDVYEVAFGSSIGSGGGGDAGGAGGGSGVVMTPDPVSTYNPWKEDAT